MRKKLRKEKEKVENVYENQSVFDAAAQSSTSTEIPNEGEYLNFRMNHNADPAIVEKETEEKKPESLLEKPVGNQYQTLQLSSPETAQSSTSTEIPNEGEYLNFRMNHTADPDIVEKETEEKKAESILEKSVGNQYQICPRSSPETDTSTYIELSNTLKELEVPKVIGENETKQTRKLKKSTKICSKKLLIFGLCLLALGGYGVAVGLYFRINDLIPGVQNQAERNFNQLMAALNEVNETQINALARQKILFQDLENVNETQNDVLARQNILIEDLESVNKTQNDALARQNILIEDLESVNETHNDALARQNILIENLESVDEEQNNELFYQGVWIQLLRYADEMYNMSLIQQNETIQELRNGFAREGNWVILFNGYRYYYGNDGMNWNDATSWCSNLGGYLASNGVKDINTRSLLRLALDWNEDEIWIGLSFKSVQNSWIWSDGEGAAINSTVLWSYGYPKVQNSQSCAFVDGEYLLTKNTQCNDRKRFLCEKTF